MKIKIIEPYHHNEKYDIRGLTPSLGPVVIASIPTPDYANHLALAGDIAYLTVVTTEVPTVGNGQLLVVDIANPCAPALIGSVPISGSYATVDRYDHVFPWSGDETRKVR